MQIAPSTTLPLRGLRRTSNLRNNRATAFAATTNVRRIHHPCDKGAVDADRMAIYHMP